jgi:tetratricopeptide (TPR) repeat protein
MKVSRLVCVLGLAAATLLAGGCKTRSLVAVRESGDQHYFYGEYPAALEDYKEYVDRSPGNAHVYHMMGNTLVKLGDTGLGAEQLKIAHTLKLEDDEIFVSLCEGLYADKKFDDLNRTLRERTVDRGRMQDWALLASFADRLGDQDEAQRAWLTAARVDGGKSAIPQLGLARLYMKVGDKGRARQRIAMAYYCDPMNAEVVALTRELGEIPGPTFGVIPHEQRMAQMPESTATDNSKVTGVETRDGK